MGCCARDSNSMYISVTAFTHTPRCAMLRCADKNASTRRVCEHHPWNRHWVTISRAAQQRAAYVWTAYSVTAERTLQEVAVTSRQRCRASERRSGVSLIVDQVVVYPLRRAPLVENDALSSEIVQTVLATLVQSRLRAAVRSARIDCTQCRKVLNHV